MTDEMTSESARTYLETLFVKAGKPDGRYRTDEEQVTFLSENGAQRFKRKALGLCGRTTLKSLDEVAQLLVDTNIAQSIEEARQYVPKIVQANELHSHAINRGGLGYMAFDEIKNPSGDVKYKITAWTAD